MLPEEVPEDIGKDVVDDDQHGGHYEVNETREDVEADAPRGCGADESGDNYPSEEPELILEEALLEGEDKAEETNDEERKADKVVIEKQFSDEGIFDSEVGQADGNEFAELVVVKREENVPINVFGHGYLHFFFLVALDVVDL